MTRINTRRMNELTIACVKTSIRQLSAQLLTASDPRNVAFFRQLLDELEQTLAFLEARTIQ